MIRADNLMHEILAQPTSDYMSAVNTLSNGSQMVREAAAEIRPPPSKAELDDVVDQLLQQHRNPEQINQHLEALAGTGRLKDANAVLGRAAKRIDDAYGKLAACFRESQCRPGFDADMLCKALHSIKRSIDAANEAGRNIPGVHYNASGTAPMLSGGFMDVDFSSIRTPNVEYLLSASCAN
jgi:hypothetical protein